MNQAPPDPEKGTGPFCRNGPTGAAHKMDLSPFPLGKWWVCSLLLLALMLNYMDRQTLSLTIVPNRITAEAFETGLIPAFRRYACYRSEFPFGGDSRNVELGRAVSALGGVSIKVGVDSVAMMLIGLTALLGPATTARYSPAATKPARKLAIYRPRTCTCSPFPPSQITRAAHYPDQ